MNFLPLNEANMLNWDNHGKFDKLNK